MKKLSKTQLTLFITSAISLILDFVITNSEALGIGSKVVIGITLIQYLYSMYNSFSDKDMVEFADEVVNQSDYKMKGISPLTTEEKLKAYINK